MPTSSLLPYWTTKPLKFNTFELILINEASWNTDKICNLFKGSLWKSNNVHSTSYITASCSTEFKIVYFDKFLCLINVKILGLMFGAIAYSLGPKWWEPFQTFRGFYKLVRFLLRSQLRYSQSPQSWSPHRCRTGARCGGGLSPSADASWVSPAVASFVTSKT